MKTNEIDAQEELERSVEGIANGLANFEEQPEEELRKMEEEHGSLAAAYCADAYDIRSEVSIDTQDQPSVIRLLVAFGGPDIWVNFYSDGTFNVEGCWWGNFHDTRQAVRDPLGCWEHLRGLWRTQ